MLAVIEVKYNNKNKFIRLECRNQEEGRYKINLLKDKYPSYEFIIMSWFDI